MSSQKIGPSSLAIFQGMSSTGESEPIDSRLPKGFGGMGISGRSSARHGLDSASFCGRRPRAREGNDHWSIGVSPGGRTGFPLAAVLHGCRPRHGEAAPHVFGFSRLIAGHTQ